MNGFHFTSYAQEVIFGSGSLARLSEAIDRMGWRSVLLCTSGSMRRNGTITALENLLGERLVAIYEHAQSHVPASQVEEGVKLAQEKRADALIGLGGGSPLGLAKAVSFALEGGRDAALAESVTPLTRPLIPVIAIPTTYAGSEMTPVYGVTRVVDGQVRKLTVSDPRIVPALVIYDPQLTLNLSPSVTASTGINALAHCVEALYSLTRNPPATAVALAGVRVIMSALPRCYVAGDDLEARLEMLEGAHLAGSSLAHVTMALHHGLCHVLGGTAGVPHGVANSIILPHAMRFNLDATASQLAPIASAMGISPAGHSSAEVVEEAIERIDELIQRMNLPRRLREVGVSEADLPQLARLAFQSRTVQSNPKPIQDVSQLEELLRAAW